MNRLKNKVVVITGGNSGIGLATAKLFATEGASVIITGRNEKSLHDAAKEIGANTLAIKCDVSNLNEIDKFYKTIKEQYDGIDIIIANAGIVSFFPITNADEKSYDELMNTNAKGVYFTIQKALPILRNGGSIVINSSTGWMKGFPTTSVYSATKAAIRSYARTFAAELVERNIRVNVVSPEPIETPIYERTGGLPKEAIPHLKETFTSTSPMKRFGEAIEVAKAILFLASDDASYITGVDIPVDGGISML